MHVTSQFGWSCLDVTITGSAMRCITILSCFEQRNLELDRSHLKKNPSAQTGRIGLTKVLLSSFSCLFVYLYFYSEVFENWHTSAAYKVLSDQLKTCNNNFGPKVYFFKENGTFQLNDSSVKTFKTLSQLTIISLVGINFQNISTPWTNSVKEILNNRTRPLLTLFTTWSESKDKYNVHNITSLNWLSLRPFIIPVVFTNETSLAEECSLKGWLVFPVMATSAKGAPVLKHMYLVAMKKFNSEFYAFANSDVLFTDTLVETLLAVLENDSSFKGHTLIKGKRTNGKYLTKSEGSSWSRLVSVSKKRGELFGAYAEDYFIPSASYPWKDIPNIVIGRRAYDNWLVLNGRRMKHRVIDATETILAVHQTTEAGNFEGWKHLDPNYNHELLVKLYKNIPYTTGYTDCAEFITKKDKMKICISRPPKLAKYCNLQ